MNVDQVNPEAKFREMFAYATGLYANPGTHEGSPASYWGFLRGYPLEILREAFRRAVKSSPEFFPSAARVRECAEAASKTASLAKPDYSRPALASREFVPAVGAGHEEWINEGANDFEKLGRMWQVESKHLGLKPDQETPPEIGQRRWKEFWVTWNKSGSKTASTNGMRQAGSVSPLTGNGSSASQPSTTSSAGALSHGDGCVCERCMPAVMREAGKLGVMR